MTRDAGLFAGCWVLSGNKVAVPDGERRKIVATFKPCTKLAQPVFEQERHVLVELGCAFLAVGETCNNRARLNRKALTFPVLKVFTSYPINSLPM